VFVNCHAVGDYLNSTWRVPTRRIQVCHNGFEEQEFHPYHRSRPVQLADASVVIGTVAVLREEKNLATLIDAFAQVAPVVRRAKLLIVGSGPMRPLLERRVQELNLGEACMFEAASNTPAQWMRAIDIFVLPSRSEAFPNAVLEAMACGCCPVASRIGGVPELIRHNERGVLFEAGNTRELADALCNLALDSNRREALACAACVFVRRHLTIEAAASRLAGIYKQLLEQEGYV
jgi:glycosyltransferase involved in cell wall biosynthesis